MDPPLNPPVRIVPVSSTPLSSKAAEKQLAAFVEDFQVRGAAAAGGNGAATVQLKKLKDALHDERKKNKSD
ncbi:hypothetical protein DFP72DRAFT_54605 [Ephemerocybe angulata]|uniref:Uncharacterized protein n=1 Tax=Ephemerocybe angulata TaxID=980116 RepID=A0A8H6I898_9AGAR|nr:hypothetical protein DFP72DRAFT_54605 [Tulosesus angulatus]